MTAAISMAPVRAGESIIPLPSMIMYVMHIAIEITSIQMFFLSFLLSIISQPAYKDGECNQSAECTAQGREEKYEKGMKYSVFVPA